MSAMYDSAMLLRNLQTKMQSLNSVRPVIQEYHMTKCHLLYSKQGQVPLWPMQIDQHFCDVVKWTKSVHQPGGGIQDVL